MTRVADWFRDTDLTWTELEAERELLKESLVPSLRGMVGGARWDHAVTDYSPVLEDELYGNGTLQDRHDVDLDRLPVFDQDMTGSGPAYPLVFLQRDVPVADGGPADMERRQEQLLAGAERGTYAAAIDPVGKHIHLRDRSMEYAVEWFRKTWTDTTTVDRDVTLAGDGTAYTLDTDGTARYV